MPKLYEYDDEHRDLAQEWRARVNKNIDDHETRLRQMETFIARTLGWICCAQFVGVGLVGLLDYFLKR